METRTDIINIHLMIIGVVNADWCSDSFIKGMGVQ